ncbi:MAG: TOBE domain-containing protein [Syntrophobacteraceae bacterium]|jgi:molybdopterin-binding protein|nr:TOBE domain-containing protein [Syntrophobacteraceae bacterium]
MQTSIRNHLKGKIKTILQGDVVSEIEVETPAGTVTSVITTNSVRRLNLKAGDDVYAVVKATEVSIEKD